MTEKRLLLIFIKNEVMGKVKTRLASTLGDSKALEVYRSLLDKTMQETSQLLNVDKIVYYSDEIAHNDRWDDAEFGKEIQYPGSLGERMIRAFRSGFEKGYTNICIIGSDCWDLDHHVLGRAYADLKSNDFVIGPANDGGYYLLGMNELLPELFEGKTFSTESVFQEAVKEIEQAGKRYSVLPELIDIDTEKDLQKTDLRHVLTPSGTAH